MKNIIIVFLALLAITSCSSNNAVNPKDEGDTLFQMATGDSLVSGNPTNQNVWRKSWQSPAQINLTLFRKINLFAKIKKHEILFPDLYQGFGEVGFGIQASEQIFALVRDTLRVNNDKIELTIDDFMFTVDVANLWFQFGVYGSRVVLTDLLIKGIRKE